MAQLPLDDSMEGGIFRANLNSMYDEQYGGHGNALYVGADRTYAEVDDALAVVAGNTATNPFTIFVDPGQYAAFTLNKAYTTIQGAGQFASIFDLTVGDTSISIANPAVYVAINDIGVNWNTGRIGGSQIKYAISRSGTVLNAAFKNVRVNILGYGAGWSVGQASAETTWTWHDCVTISEGICLRGAGRLRLYNCTNILTGTWTAGENTAANPHICFDLFTGCRAYFYGGHYGMGYYADDGVVYTLDDDMGNTYLFNTESGTAGQNRIFLWDVHGFCRNEAADGGAVVDNFCVNSINGGWVRMFGCHFQSESDTNISNNHAINVDAASKCEVYGTRYSRALGNVFGQGVEQVLATRARYEKYEGGLKAIDATAGNVNIPLPALANCMPGERWSFYRVDATANTITITAGAGTTIGNAASVALVGQGDSITMEYNPVTADFAVVGLVTA